MTTANPNKKNFVGSFDLHSLTGSPTCYKSINLIYIDLVLTNKKKRFMKSATFETNNNLTTTILRKTISKCNSKKKLNKHCKRFDQKAFETELKLKLDSQTNLNYSSFQEPS